MTSPAEILQGKILIVDDQQENILLLQKTLRDAGYQAVTATLNPAEACDLHRKNRYDLILLDIQMPVMDGFQVMAGLKEIEAGNYLPVLVLTAHPDQKLLALKAGAHDFVSKPFDLAEVLLRVHNMLEVRLLHRETQQLYDRVVAQQVVSERLLLNLLPHSVAERVKGHPSLFYTDGSASFNDVIADKYDEVTVLFADIVEFTKFSETVSPAVLIGVLNDVFARFDTIAAARGLEKIKTIGDAYMATAGLPVPVPDHAVRVAHMALDMIYAINRFNENQHYSYKIDVRIGIDSGPAVAGIVGQHKFVYDLWGDVVNTASRMESHGVVGRIHVTDATRQRLGEPFMFEKRGVIDVKGKGEMHTWFLNSRNSESLPE